MGVIVRENVKGSGNWYVYINYKVFSTANLAISFADAEMVAKLLEERSSNSK